MTKYLYMVGPAVLLCLALPLGLLAIVTTTIATVTLFLRISVVYVDLGLALIHSWSSSVFVRKRTSRGIMPVPHLHQGPQAPLHLFPNEGHGFSTFKETSDDLHPTRTPLPTSESYTSLLGAGVPNRDFEGVGGWRLTDKGQDEGLVMNSRLQLPATNPGVRRMRKRSLTSHSQRSSTSPESYRMSPVASRTKSPIAAQEQSQREGYFDTQGQALAISPEEIATQARMDQRRLSVSSSNASSFSDLKMFTTGMTQLPTV